MKREATPGAAEFAHLPALILAGGLGKRLRPVLPDRPKALAPVAGRPFLDYQLEWLHSQGLRRIVLCLGYRAGAIRRRYGDGGGLDLDIRYSIERKPLGTAGALRHAEAAVGGDSFLALNGDSFCQVDLSLLVGFHRRRGALATIALARVRRTERFGAVYANRTGRILRFAEKEKAGAAGGGRQWINAGVYAFQREVLKRIPAGRAVSLETEIFPALVGNRLYGYPAEGYFRDIGVPADYARAQKEMEAGIQP